MDGINRVKGLQNDGKRENVRSAREAEEGKPDQHDGPEGLADAAGSGVLNREEGRDDHQCDDDDLHLVGSEEAVHDRHAPQTFHGGGNGDGRRQDAVRQQGCPAEHGGHDQPLAAAPNQGEERKDAALSVVVRLHGNQDILDGCKKGDGPDDERERSDDKRFVNLGDSPVALEDRLHDVQRRGADVAVDDSDGHEKHAETKFRLFIHTLSLRIFSAHILLRVPAVDSVQAYFHPKVARP